MNPNRDDLTKLLQSLTESASETDNRNQPGTDLRRYEVILRTGFETCFGGLRRNRNHKWRNDKDTHVFEYPLESPIAGALRNLDRTDSSHLVFVDDVFDHMEVVLARLNSVLDVNPSLEVLTFQSPALANLQGDGILRNELTILPSWFCVVSRSILKQYVSASSAYITLEYFLLELAGSLNKAGIDLVVSDAMNLEFDYAGWAADLLLKNSPRLAADFRNARQSSVNQADAIAVPDQFKVTMSGEYTELLEVDQNDSASQASAAPTPTFSVICPIFKSNFVQELVESVIQQSWSDWEFIMIVDGPPEAERERIVSILETYSFDDRITWILQANQGTGPTRKRLAETAKGQIVVPTDDDDRLHPELLMNFKRAFDTNPNAKVIRGGAQLCGLVDTYLTPRQRAIVSGISADIFEVTQPYAVKRDSLIELGGYEGDQTYGEAGEDSDLFLKIDHAGLETCLIDRPLYFRRITAVNQTLSFDPEIALAHLKRLIKRHLSADWEFVDFKFAADQDGFAKSAAVYRNRDTRQEIVTATRFFDYQTLGSDLDVTIDLEVTSRCDAESIPDALNGNIRNGSYIQLDLIELLARQIAQRDVKNEVVIGGAGEPTLHPRLTSIVKKLSKSGARVTLRTTGHNINSDLLDRLVSSGLAVVDFAVNASTSEVYEQVMCLSDLKRVKSNLRSAIEHRHSYHPDLMIQASFVYCDQNEAEISDFVSEWKDSGVSSIRIHPVTRRGGVFRRDLSGASLSSIPRHIVEDAKVTIEYHEHRLEDGNVCRIIQKNDVIGVDGELLLCGLDSDRILSLGNMRNSLLKDLHLSKFLRYKRGEINQICSGCEFCPSLIDYLY